MKCTGEKITAGDGSGPTTHKSGLSDYSGLFYGVWIEKAKSYCGYHLETNISTTEVKKRHKINSGLLLVERKISVQIKMKFMFKLKLYLD